MSYTIKSTTWSQWYHPDYQHGWVGEPDQGTELGTMNVRVEPDRGESHEFFGFEFRGSLTFYKDIGHKADPIYSVRFTGGEKNLTEDQIPADILEAFETGDVEAR